MKVSELSLGHKCYHVTVDSIDEAEVEGIIRTDTKPDKAMVCFKNDKNRYIVPLNAKTIFSLYFFSYEEACKRQHKLRLNALWAASVKKAKAEENYSKTMEKYGEYQH